MKKNLAILAGMILGCIIIMVILWLVMDSPRLRNNGFERTFIINDLPLIREGSVGSDIKYIVGVTKSSIFFSTLTPGEVAWTSFRIDSIRKVQLLRDSAILSKLKPNNNVIVDSPRVLIAQGSSKIILQTDLKKLSQSVHLTKELFSRIAVVSPSTLLMRKFKPGEMNQYMYRFSLDSNTATIEVPIFNLSNDGGIQSDGILSYDRASELGVYVHYYRNKLVLMDSNLNVRRIARTIDTFSSATVKTNVIDDKGKGFVTSTGPAIFVNKASCAANGLLYIYSDIKASNQTIEDFLHNKTLDVYKLSDLSYVGSLKIKGLDRQKIRNIAISDNKLLLLFENYLTIYNLAPLMANVLNSK